MQDLASVNQRFAPETAFVQHGEHETTTGLWSTGNGSVTESAFSDVRQGQCFNTFERGRCLNPRPMRVSRAKCCCSKGMAWTWRNEPCAVCPRPGDRTYPSRGSRESHPLFGRLTNSFSTFGTGAFLNEGKGRVGESERALESRFFASTQSRRAQECLPSADNLQVVFTFQTHKWIESDVFAQQSLH